MSDNDTRPLTQDEAALVPLALQNLQLDIENTYYFGYWDNVPYFAREPKGPWVDKFNHPLDLLSLIPNSEFDKPPTLEGYTDRWSRPLKATSMRKKHGKKAAQLLVVHSLQQPEQLPLAWTIQPRLQNPTTSLS
jgi:hypothetical protein